MKNTTKNPAAVALGSSKSTAKTSAARENGKKGGRPTEPTLIEYTVRRDGDSTQHSEWVNTNATTRAGLVAALKRSRSIDGVIIQISAR